MQGNMIEKYLKLSLRSLDNCIFPVFLYSSLIMVAKETETCRFILINDKSYFISVHLLVC